MGALLTAIQLVGPVVLRGAEAGTLVEIVDTATRLAALLRPLLTDPDSQASLDALAATVTGAAAFRPAQPGDPALASRSATHFGGR